MAKILLVEDQTDIRKILGLLLAPKGHEIIEAGDGKAAVEIASEQQPDIILMDMSLPVLSGWDATRALKFNPATAHIPVIALTAHTMRGDRERAWEAGCDAYITKPIDDELLEHSIEQILAEKSDESGGGSLSPEEVAVSSAPRNVQGKVRTIHNAHVFIIGDRESGACQVIEAELKSEGYRTSFVSHPDEAIANIESEGPDLLIIEAGASGIQAAELARKIREADRSAFIPILFLVDEDAELDEATTKEADDLLTKPVNAVKLSIRVRSLVRLKLALSSESNRANELASVLSQMVAGLIILDAEGMVSIVNGRGLKILDISLDDVIGVHIDDLINRLRLTDSDCLVYERSQFPLIRALSNAETVEKEVICVHRDGKQVNLRVGASPIFNEHGRLIGAVSIFDELTT